MPRRRPIPLLVLVLFLGGPAARSQNGVGSGDAVPDLAWLGEDGVHLIAGGADRLWPGTQGVDTFTFDAPGRALLVTRNDGSLQRVAPDGRRRTLASGFRRLRFPAASGDGRRIAFACSMAEDPGAGWNIRVTGADGRGNIEIGPGYAPCFGPSGDELIFEAYDEDGPDLWSVTLPPATRSRLFAKQEGGRHTPAIAPDDRRIAYSSQGRLWLRSRESALPRLLGAVEETYDRFASFSPDGSRLLHLRQQGSRESLVLQSLTPPGSETVLVADAVRLARFRPGPERRGPEGLDPNGARDFLERHPSGPIDLSDLRDLDPETAAVLAGARESLLLDGLHQLDEKTAGALSGWAGNGEEFLLSLDGLETVSPAIIRELARSRGWGLSLSAIETLDPAILRALAGYRGALLRLSGLREIDRDAAKVIAETWQVKWIRHEPGLRVDPEARRLLDAARIGLVHR